MFLNRARELGYLNDRYGAGRAEIVVLYGRRRVGKSALLFEWSEGRPCIFFFARRADKSTLLGEFSRAISAFRTGNPALDDFTYPSWSAAFGAITEMAAEQRLVVVLDEFPYLVEADPELPSLLQREWDLRLQHTQLFLVLSGSIQSVIRQQVLDPTAPLYRRHTWPFELKPLTLIDLPAFFPRYTAEQLVETFAVLGGMPYYLVSVDPQLSLLTNMFLHGGWLHLIGNMVYLWIFGDNIEAAMGRIRYLTFYLLCGVLASLSHALTDPTSVIPTIGASGAISGILGAYLLLYPRARVLVLIPLGFFTRLMYIPAAFALGFWFLLQLLSGSMTAGHDAGGVAFWAHIGGGVAGLLLVGLFKRRDVRFFNPPQYRPNADEGRSRDFE